MHAIVDDVMLYQFHDIEFRSNITIVDYSIMFAC
jgi:hypothetical protein